MASERLVPRRLRPSARRVLSLKQKDDDLCPGPFIKETEVDDDFTVDDNDEDQANDDMEVDFIH